MKRNEVSEYQSSEPKISHTRAQPKKKKKKNLKKKNLILTKAIEIWHQSS